MQADNEVHHLGDIFFGKHQRGRIRQWGVDTEFTVKFVTAHLGKIIATFSEVKICQQVLCGINRDWFTWT